MAGEPENQRIARLTPLADVLARVKTLVGPVAPREVRLSSALFRVLAEDVAVDGGLPAGPRALIDGYAVRAEDIADAGPYSPMPLAAAPQRIDVGAALPKGADAVAPFDAIGERGGQYQALAPVAVGDGVLAAGADLRPGDRIACQGWRLNDFNLAMLAMAGLRTVRAREPRIALVGEMNDRVRNAIGDLLARALSARGCLIERSRNLDESDPSSEAIIAIGGTGTGRDDASVLTLGRLGRVEVHGVAIAPGETTAFGLVGARPVLLLPGRIDAAIAGWLTLGGPLVDRLSGSSDAADPATAAVLARKVASPLGLAEVVPVRVAAGKAEPIASGYWALAALAATDGWVLVPADSEGFPAGAEVMVRPWP